jgi:hypothetical protein
MSSLFRMGALFGSHARHLLKVRRALALRDSRGGSLYMSIYALPTATAQAAAV